MSVQDNKALARQPQEEVFNQGNLALVDEIFAPGFLSHSPGIPPDLSRGPEGIKGFVIALRSAFPDLQITAESAIAEGDQVVSRWTFRGTHRGEFLGVPASGKRVTTTGIDIWRLSGGKIVELRQELDMLGLLQQLGAIPSPQHAGN